jgi:hypothetical protein
MSDTFKFDPFNPLHIAAFRAADEVYRKVANIKTIPATPDDIQFVMPDIRSAPWMPDGTMYALPSRRINETDEEYAGRCVRIENIGDQK